MSLDLTYGKSTYSGNGLVPLGNKPLTEQMLIQIYVAIYGVTRPQCQDVSTCQGQVWIITGPVNICDWCYVPN